MFLRPYNDMLTVVPSDSTNLDPYTTKKLLTAGIYVGGAGDVVVVNENDNLVTFKAVPAGTLLPIAVKRVNGSGTGATLLVACYWV